MSETVQDAHRIPGCSAEPTEGSKSGMVGRGEGLRINSTGYPTRPAPRGPLRLRMLPPRGFSVMARASLWVPAVGGSRPVLPWDTLGSGSDIFHSGGVLLSQIHGVV